MINAVETFRNYLHPLRITFASNLFHQPDEIPAIHPPGLWHDDRHALPVIQPGHATQAAGNRYPFHSILGLIRQLLAHRLDEKRINLVREGPARRDGVNGRLVMLQDPMNRGRVPAVFLVFEIFEQLAVIEHIGFSLIGQPRRIVRHAMLLVAEFPEMLLKGKLPGL